MNVFRLILILSMIAITSCMSAQRQINDVIRKIESEKQAKVVYSEKRGPKSHKVYKIAETISFQSDELAKQLLNAINAERKNSVSYEIINNNNTYIIKFQNENKIDKYEILFKKRRSGIYKYFISLKKEGHKACDGSYPEWE